MNNNENYPDDKKRDFPGTIKAAYEISSDMLNSHYFDKFRNEIDSMDKDQLRKFEIMVREMYYALNNARGKPDAVLGNEFFRFLPNSQNDKFAKRSVVISRIDADATLAELLDAALSREELYKLSLLKNTVIDKRAKKDEILTAISAQMLDPMRIMPYIFWSSPEEMITFFDIGKNAEGWDVDEEDDDLPFTFLYGGYVFPAGGNVFRISHDVTQIVTKLWQDDEFQKIYDEYVWLQDCIDAAVCLYGIFPLDVLVTLYNLSPKYKANRERILEMLLTQPVDFAMIVVNGEYIYDAEDRRKLPDLMKYMTDDPYYIPTLPALESGLFLNTPAKLVNTRLADFLYNVLGFDSEEAADLTWEIDEIKICSIDEEKKLNDIVDYITSNTTPNNRKRLMKLINELDPFMRKMKNHGFTDSELAAIKKEQASAHKKIIRLDDLRQKKSQKKEGGN